METPIGDTAISFWKPADAVLRCGPTTVILRLYATNEHGTTSVAVNVVLNFVPC